MSCWGTTQKKSMAAYNVGAPNNNVIDPPEIKPITLDDHG